MTTVTNDQPMADLMNSLTGFEELAIEGRFNQSVYTLFTANLVTAMRALVYVVHKRSGADDKTAYNAAMNMPVLELDDFFPDDEEEPIPDEPTTESGKDDSVSD